MNAFPVDRLADAFRKRFGGEVQFEAEVVGGIERFSFYLVSPQFQPMSHLKRQDAVWEVIDSILSREEALQVSAVLPLAPGEIESLVR
jgi:acid stress-induced BolA-like protein IbaG/YrbA